jgi:hypothetical protein
MRLVPLLLLAAFPLAAAAQDMQPGKYRVTMTSDMPGMEGKPVIQEQCFTRKDVDSGLTEFGMQKDADCKISDLKRSAGRVAYRMTCTQGGRKTTSETEGTFGADSFDFKMVSKMPEFPKPFAFRSVGKRSGDCK